jgi:hypothetical protein
MAAPPLCIEGDAPAAAAFSDDGRRLIVARINPVIAVCEHDATTGAELSTHAFFQAGCEVREDGGCVLSCDGKTLACAGVWPKPDGSDGEATLHVFDTATKATLFTCAGSACQLSPDGGVLCVFNPRKSEARVFHVATRRLVHTVSFQPLLIPNGVRCCALDWQNTRLLTPADKVLLLWSVTAGDDEEQEPITTLEGHNDNIYTCAFSRDGDTLLSGSDDGTVRLWDAQARTCTRVLTLHESGRAMMVTGCAFSACGCMLASVEEHNNEPIAKLWAVASGRCVRTMHELDGAEVAQCAFSPDGSKLLLLNDYGGHVHVRDISAERDRCSPAAAAACLAASSTARCDLLALLRSGEDADVTLRAACGREFKAHRAILRLRSSTLKAQLSGAYADSRAVVDVAADIPAAVLERLLQFIYADELAPAGREEAAALLAASAFFGVPRLGAICEHALAAALTADNATDTLLLADRHSATLLRNAALLCAAASADAMVDTDGWARLVATQPALMADVVHTLAKGAPPPLLRRAAQTMEEAGVAAASEVATAHGGGGDAEQGREGRSTRQRLQ